MKNRLPEQNWKPMPGVHICQACCDQGIIEAVGGGMFVFHCEAHMTLCVKDGEVLWAQTNGVRQ